MTVVTHAVSEYRRPLLRDAVETLATREGWRQRFSGKRVLLKPNLLAAVAPERAVTTHPLVLWAVGCILRDLGATLWVGDSSGETMAQKRQTERAYRVCGIADVAKSLGAKLVRFERFNSIRLAGWERPPVLISGVIQEVDAIVSLPKFKTHTGYVLTGGVKNLYGLVPGHLKARLHAAFPQIGIFGDMLKSIYRRVQPAYTLVDAIVGMEGDGPMAGQSRQIGFLLGSSDGFAVDRVIAEMMGADPRLVPTLPRDGATPLLHSLDGPQVPRPIDGFLLPQTVGQSWRRRRRFSATVTRHLLYPRISKDRCDNCGTCQEMCPVSAIRGQTIAIKQCIGCLCCHEMCQAHAIELAPPPFTQRALAVLQSLLGCERSAGTRRGDGETS